MKQRVISAIIVIAIITPLFILGGIPFAVAVGIVAGLAYIETLSLKESHRPYPTYIKVLGFLCLELIVFSHISSAYIFNGISFLSLAIPALTLTIPAIFDKKNKYTTKESFHLLGSITLLGVVFNILILICNGNKWLLLYLILVATLTDTFAMLIGCLIGKHKLIPDVSPKKTVEGSVAGSIVGTIVSSIYYYNVVTGEISIILLIIMSLILTILGQLGDLFFSKVKRENNIKDFSNIIPGHGGILDRLDSITFVMLGYMIIISVLNIIR